MDFLEILPQVGPIGAPTGAMPHEPAADGGAAPFCFWPKTRDTRLPGGTTPADGGQSVPFCPGPEPFMHFAALPPAGSLPACDNPGGSELLTDTSRDAHRTLKTRPARTKILQRS